MHSGETADISTWRAVQKAARKQSGVCENEYVNELGTALQIWRMAYHGV